MHTNKLFRSALVVMGLFLFVGCGSSSSDDGAQNQNPPADPAQPAAPADPKAPSTGTTCVVPAPGLAKDVIVYHKGAQGAGTSFQAGVAYIGNILTVYDNVAVKVNFNGVGEQIVAIAAVLPQAFCAPDAIVGKQIVFKSTFRSGVIVRVFAEALAEVDWTDSADNSVEKLSDLALAQ